MGIKTHTKLVTIHQGVNLVTGAQPGIFQGRGGFVKLGTSINILSKSQEKRPRREKLWSFFLLDTLTTIF